MREVQLASPDFPAAHSMDTTWFGVDGDGFVAEFDSGENGWVPAHRVLISKDADEVFDYFDDGGYILDLVAVIPSEIVARVENLAMPHAHERAAWSEDKSDGLDRLFDGFDRLLSSKPSQLKIDLVTFAATGGLLGRNAKSLALNGQIQLVQKLKRREYVRLHERQECVWCFDYGEAADVLSPELFFQYEYGDRDNRNYRKASSPNVPLAIEMIPQTIQDQMLIVTLEGVSFSGQSEIRNQPELASLGWGKNAWSYSPVSKTIFPDLRSYEGEAKNTILREFQMVLTHLDALAKERGYTIDRPSENPADDFPAAHSMDTDWFAVDEDGHLGFFSSGDTGAVPAERIWPTRNTELALREAVRRCLGGTPKFDGYYSPMGGAEFTKVSTQFSCCLDFYWDSWLLLELASAQPEVFLNNLKNRSGQHCLDDWDPYYQTKPLVMVSKADSSLHASERPSSKPHQVECSIYLGSEYVLEFLNDVPRAEFQRFHASGECLWSSLPTTSLCELLLPLLGIFLFECEFERYQSESTYEIAPIHRIKVSDLPPTITDALAIHDFVGARFETDTELQLCQKQGAVRWGYRCWKLDRTAKQITRDGSLEDYWEIYEDLSDFAQASDFSIEPPTDSPDSVQT